MSMLLFDDSLKQSNNGTDSNSDRSNSFSSKDTVVNNNKSNFHELLSEINHSSTLSEPTPNSITIYRSVIENLMSQIDYLKEEINFLRSDSNKKSVIIEKLVDKNRIKINENTFQNAPKTPVVNKNVTDTSLLSSNEKNHSFYQFPPIHESISDIGDISIIGDTIDNKSKNSISSKHNSQILGDTSQDKSNNSSPSKNMSKDMLELSNVYTENDSTRPWGRNTTLIAGDSILYGIEEKRLKNTKVRVFPGASIEDMHFNLTPLLRKKPANVIIHIGTNNCPSHEPDVIADKLFSLQNFIATHSPASKIIFSNIITRCDDIKAQSTAIRVNQILDKSHLNILDNSQINRDYLGKKGLHLNRKGTIKFAMNLIKVLKQL